MEKNELITLYFEKKLTPFELNEVKSLLETDEAFKAAFNFYETTAAAITITEREKQKAQFISFENSSNKSKRIYWMAAAAAVIILVTSWFIWINNTATKKDLFVSYYQTYPNVEAPTVRGETSITNKTEAFSLYDNKNYKEALAKFDTIYSIENNTYALFYAAICNMELKDYYKALVLFKKLPTNGWMEYEAAKKWYSALCYVQIKDIVSAKSILQTFGKNDTLFFNQANQLLKDLD